ncbi:signal peptidase I [Erysipelothrix urinaevulpis]|uniref:signal peptidase I n=1 Tax=Erysipelothrix urinaevulpis TaxID=2683717 RepID=UPI001357FDA6|nr:signal peptidase I [Erysipelothrix urinaevulpis]
MNKSRRNSLFYVIMIVVSLIIGTMMFLPKIAGRINPFKTMVVVSESMEPVINRNDLIVVKSVKDYEVGDIITFSYDINNDGHDDLITHYLAERDGDTIKTKSNKGSSLDHWEIKEHHIVGKVVNVIPKLGYVLIPLFKYAVPILFIALILVLLCIVKVYREYQIIKTKE